MCPSDFNDNLNVTCQIKTYNIEFSSVIPDVKTKGGGAANFLLRGGTEIKGGPKIKEGSCETQGHHVFGKYLILFMIIYMMVKLGLVL